MEKKILTNIRGIKSPDHITLKINRRDLKKFPNKFFIDLTADEMRDATPREDQIVRRRR